MYVLVRGTDGLCTYLFTGVSWDGSVPWDHGRHASHCSSLSFLLLLLLLPPVWKAYTMRRKDTWGKRGWQFRGGRPLGPTLAHRTGVCSTRTRERSPGETGTLDDGVVTFPPPHVSWPYGTRLVTARWERSRLFGHTNSHFCCQRIRPHLRVVPPFAEPSSETVVAPEICSQAVSAEAGKGRNKREPSKGRIRIHPSIHPLSEYPCAAYGVYAPSFPTSWAPSRPSEMDSRRPPWLGVRACCSWGARMEANHLLIASSSRSSALSAAS